MTDAGPPEAPGRPRPARRPPKRPTPERLHKQALHHLERFAASSAHLRMLLRRRALRAARHHGLPAAEVEAMVDAVVAKLLAAGLLDDRLYAEARTRSLAEAGRSARRIRGTLRQKGVATDDIDQAWQRLEADRGEVELQSAVTLARRRRLGPYRPPAERPANRTRDLAALARAGYGYDLARRVVDAVSVDELEEEARQAAEPPP